MNKTTDSAQVGRQVQLPLRKAFEISLRSIRIRFWRSMITAGGIMLGIAFLASVLTTALIQAHMPDANMDARALQAAQNRQTWLVIMSLPEEDAHRHIPRILKDVPRRRQHGHRHRQSVAFHGNHSFLPRLD